MNVVNSTVAGLEGYRRDQIVANFFWPFFKQLQIKDQFVLLLGVFALENNTLWSDGFRWFIVFGLWVTREIFYLKTAGNAFHSIFYGTDLDETIEWAAGK